ncbi:MAG TPA: hypothetical protein VHX88_06220 [Solirubrobacteraceae bacterium]|nr:hypothetical protein [Solirubrobacteraceae bacterium]
MRRTTSGSSSARPATLQSATARWASGVAMSSRVRTSASAVCVGTEADERRWVL